MSKREFLPEGREVDKLNHLAKLGQVVDGGLGLLQLETNSVRLADNLEDGIANGGLVESVIDL